MNSINEFIFNAVIVLVPMILSLTVHEYAHAFAAHRLGDDTALRQGRLTLNPLSHIDPIGTLILPLVLLGTGTAGIAPIFGWARPVPYNPLNLDRRVSTRTGGLLIAAAGPVSNLLIALVVTVIVGLAARFGVLGAVPEAYRHLMQTMITLNVTLAVFNFIPLPPLDGSKVLYGLLPAKSAEVYDQITARAGLLLLIAFVSLGGAVIAYPTNLVLSGLMRFILHPLAGGGL